MTRYQPFEITLGGRAYKATWSVEDSVLQVSSAYGSATAPVGDGEQATLNSAKRLFRDMINARRSSERRSRAF